MDETINQSKSLAEIHRAWGRAIQDAVSLIDMWEVESEDEILTPPETINVTPEES